jgi:hypothetical protein
MHRRRLNTGVQDGDLNGTTELWNGRKEICYATTYMLTGMPKIFNGMTSILNGRTEILDRLAENLGFLGA